MRISPRIAIDAFPLAGRITGIGRYVLELAKVLDTILPCAHFYLYSPSPLSVSLPSDRWHPCITGVRFPSSYVWLKTFLNYSLHRSEPDVFWATRTILPGPGGAFATVATVHDLNWWVAPDSMPFATRMAHRLWFAKDVRRADAVVANSWGTAQRLKEFTGVYSNHIAPPAISGNFRPQSKATIAALLSQIGITQPYFLTVGTMEPRKNLPMLIDAFIGLKRSGQLKEHTLVIAGGAGWHARRLHHKMEEASGSGVRWLGFVSDNELATLYAGATAFVMPSLYEGFGMPALEARACGTQVVATDIPELRQASGDAGIFVEPTEQGISEGLLAATRNSRSVRPTQMDWSDSARIMADIFMAVVKR